MVQKSADIGVMKGLGGRGGAISRGDFRIRHECLHNRFEILVLKGIDEFGEG